MFKSLTKSFIHYSLVGAIATMLHYAIFLICIYYFLLAPWKSTLLGSTYGAFTAYFLNYHHTFSSQTKHSLVFPKFLLVACLGIFVQTIIVAVFSIHLHYLLAQLMATVAALILTFTINRFWTFT
jgi:putative flippase GtrA